VGSHPSIVEYEEVMLHNDDDDSIKHMLQKGYATGKLQSRIKRTKFPVRYICLTQELMNRGTVQDWLDDEMLLPGGMFKVTQQVASALAYMHENEITHNDIKPENIMLHQEAHGKESPVSVKLGDLGLAVKSTNRTNDFWQTGMTMFCMIMGEKFGSRKYRLEHSDGFVDEVAQAIEQVGVDAGRLSDTLADVPGVMRDIFHERTTMAKIAGRDTLQGWSFFDGEASESAAPPPQADKRMKVRRVEDEKIHQTVDRAGKRAVNNMGW